MHTPCTQSKYLNFRAELPGLLAIIMWGADVPHEANVEGQPPVISWNGFLKCGAGISTTSLDERSFDKRCCSRAGHCCSLIYTSGTTGNPKAVSSWSCVYRSLHSNPERDVDLNLNPQVMMSHDNLIFESVCVWEV